MMKEALRCTKGRFYLLTKGRAFTGMDNVSGGSVSDGLVIPDLIINATVTDGMVKKRGGYALSIPITGCHSLCPRSVPLCAGTGKLYLLNLDAGTKTEVASLPTSAPLSYVEIGLCIFISSRDWCGVYESGIIRKWGKIIDDLDDMNWVQAENGEYFLADPQGNATATMKPHEHVHAPDPMEHIIFAHGRIWGSRGTVLYYSDGMSPEWFQDDVNQIPFQDEIKMIAPSQGGLFIGFDNKVIFLNGSDPATMGYTVRKPGALPYTMQQIHNFGDFGTVPAWGTPKGKIMAGMPDGSLVDLTAGKTKFTISEAKGSSFRVVNGKPRYSMTFEMPDDGSDIINWLKG